MPARESARSAIDWRLTPLTSANFTCIVAGQAVTPRQERCIAMTRPTLLFVHGAWHGSWCWEPVRQILSERGWTTAAVDLPTVHAPDKAALGMAADADAVRAAIDAIDGDVVVAAHSYGGVPTTQGADADNVTHIVYISAFVLDI